MESTNISDDSRAVSVTSARRTFSRIGFAFLALLLLASVFQVVLGLVSAFISPLQQADWWIWVVTFVPIYLIGFPAAFFIMRRLPAATPEKRSLTPLGFLAALAVAIGAMWAGSFLGNMLSALFTGGNAVNPIISYISGTNLLSILVTVLIAPVVEETIFRKLLLDRVAQYGGALAVLLSGLCFALFHTNLFQFFYAFGIGAVLAYVYLNTGRLIYPVLLHMLINAFCGEFSTFALSAMQQGLSYGTVLFSIYLVVLAAMTLGGVIFLIVCLCRKSLRFAPPKQLPHGFSTAITSPGMLVYTIFCVLLMLFVLFSPLLAAALQ